MFLEKLRNYLDKEHQLKKKTSLNLADWSLNHAKDVPQQVDPDCGIFCIKYAQYFARGSRMDFKTADMEYYRSRMVWEIKKKILLWP